MLANNEIGTIQPVAEIARLRPRSAASLVHTDAVQAAGLLDLNVDRLGVDLLSLSAHKFYAPKGVGVLYVRRGTAAGAADPRRRPGAAPARRHREPRRASWPAAPRSSWSSGTARPPCARLTALRDRLIEGIEAGVPGALLNGDRRRRLPGNASFCFRDVQGESVLLELEMDDVYASSGSACHAGLPGALARAAGDRPECRAGPHRAAPHSGRADDRGRGRAGARAAARRAGSAAERHGLPVI